MALILNLETTTKVCSVAIAKDGGLIAKRDFKSDKFSHAEKLNGFIQEVLRESKCTLQHIDAVAVSSGPGSYTGLRIGTSSAKGICFALNIPLISVNSLKALASLATTQADFICPMFDARRMEVYSAIYSNSLVEIEKTKAVVIEYNTFEAYKNKSFLIMGPGAEKCVEPFNDLGFQFDLTTEVSAEGMMKLSEDKFNKGDFEDVAYFEPAYLKDFIAGKPKKLL